MYQHRSVAKLIYLGYIMGRYYHGSSPVHKFIDYHGLDYLSHCRVKTVKSFVQHYVLGLAAECRNHHSLSFHTL